MSWASASERPRERARSVAVDELRLPVRAVTLWLRPRSSVESRLLRTSEDIMLVMRENAPPEADEHRREASCLAAMTALSMPLGLVELACARAQRSRSASAGARRQKHAPAQPETSVRDAREETDDVPEPREQVFWTDARSVQQDGEVSMPSTTRGTAHAPENDASMRDEVQHASLACGHESGGVELRRRHTRWFVCRAHVPHDGQLSESGSEISRGVHDVRARRRRRRLGGRGRWLVRAQ